MKKQYLQFEIEIYNVCEDIIATSGNDFGDQETKLKKYTIKYD